MVETSIARFWASYVESSEKYTGSSESIARWGAELPRPLPEAFVSLLTRGSVRAVRAPGCRVASVGDWLAHAIDRHRMLRHLATVHNNPILAGMIPFGDTDHGLEVALDLFTVIPRVVWLDPLHYETASAVATEVADSIEAFILSSLEEHVRIRR
jgi:hypothetical protein